jgi:hypothetical protein
MDTVPGKFGQSRHIIGIVVIDTDQIVALP